MPSRHGISPRDRSTDKIDFKLSLHENEDINRLKVVSAGTVSIRVQLKNGKLKTIN